jgi:hypothetical protein
VARTLNDNNLKENGLQVALRAVERFPENYSAWAALYDMDSASEQQKKVALAQLKRLDPLNPSLK